MSDIQIVVPDRLTYGHGLTVALANEVIQPFSANLIITISGGLSAHAPVDLIQSWPDAPDVIVTDHLPPSDTLPSAYAVVTPYHPMGTFESTALVGSGLAFYLLMLVRRAIVELIGSAPRGAAMASRMRTVALNHLSELVALGALGDRGLLDMNNRLLVKVGLDRINKGYPMAPSASHAKGFLSHGLRALLDIAGIKPPVTANHLAVPVAQLINGAGRLVRHSGKPVCDGTMALQCLLADNQGVAQGFAQRCHELNADRKQAQAAMTSAISDSLNVIVDNLISIELADHNLPDLDTLALKDDLWAPGLVGLIASRLATQTDAAVFCFAPETAGRPDIHSIPVNGSLAGGVVSADGTDDLGSLVWDDSDLPVPGNPAEGNVNWLKGSGRSNRLHLLDILNDIHCRNPDLLMQFSGHAGAASLTLYRPHLPRFRRFLAESAARLSAIELPQSGQTENGLMGVGSDSGSDALVTGNDGILDGPLPALVRTFPLAHWIEQQPWGRGFPEPQFTQTFRVVRAQGLKDEHQVLFVVDAGGQATQTPLRMMWFNSVSRTSPVLTAGETVTLTYRLTVNRFNGKNALQGMVSQRIGHR
jgi:single-stranded-DNA-specific exonuclease